MGRLLFIVIAGGLAAGLMLPSEIALDSPVADAEPVTAVVPATEGGSALAASHAMPEAGPSTVIERGDNGHYFADAQVNGMTVRFVVDTGASGVALTAADAQRVGLQFSPAEFEVIGSGASGTVSGKRVTLDRVTLGGKTVENVEGAILANSEMSLLGQSFLGRMGRIEIAGDRMTIR
jgi:aspartyl protease family protein